MALKFSKYSGEIQAGATIDTASFAAGSVDSTALGSSAVTTAKINNSAVTGVKSSLAEHFVTLAVGTNGTNSVYPFVASTAPVAGTITGYWTMGSAAAGTFTLWATTAGTIATIVSSATAGTVVGTSTLNVAVASGDTVRVNGTDATGSATAFVTFRTIN